MRHTDLTGLVVLGGRLPDALTDHLRRHGALIFPTDPQAPVDVYRASLYQADELYAGLVNGYDQTPDATAYRWAKDGRLHHDVFTTLLRAIHDDSISDALGEFLHGFRVVGIMGGHALHRDSEGYVAAARLGHALAERGLVVATGGGPGAMEAANLGAFAPTLPALDGALERLATVPTFTPDIAAWAQLALTVRADLAGEPGRPQRTVGIPTWFYGHEPPNVFCDGIAKYFSNAIREDGLLARSDAGVVVMAGAAGTVQEIFQAVTPLYYAQEGSALAKLVLVGHRHWTRDVPLWPTVQALAKDRHMQTSVFLVDDPDEAAAILLEPDHKSACDETR